LKTANLINSDIAMIHEKLDGFSQEQTAGEDKFSQFLNESHIEQILRCDLEPGVSARGVLSERHKY
jgi:hypothetical protein